MKVVPHGTHGHNPRCCQLELKGLELNGGHLHGAHHWVATVEGVSVSQGVDCRGDTALQLRDGSVWDVVPAPPQRNLAWPQQAQHDALIQVQSMKPHRRPVQSDAPTHSQPEARQWLPSPSAQHAQWPQHRPQLEQRSKPHVQRGVNHMPALAQMRQPQQRHVDQQPPGLQSLPPELEQHAVLPEHRQQTLAYDMHPQQLQTKQQRRAAESHMSQLDMLDAAMRSAAAQTGVMAPNTAGVGPAVAAGRLRAPDSSWSSGSRMQQQPHAVPSSGAARQAAPDVAPSARQTADSAVAVPSTAAPGTERLSNAPPQPVAKQQRSGRKSASGSAWQQSASQLLQGSPKQGPQLASAAQGDPKPNGHVTPQPPALSPPGPQQVLSAGKIKVRLPHPAPKDAGKMLPSPAQPGSQQLSTDEPQAKRQRVAEAALAAGPGPQLHAFSPGSHRAQRQPQQQAAGSAHTSLPPGLQSPPQHAVPPTQPGPASQRSQVQPQPQASRPGTGTSSPLPPGVQWAAQPTNSNSKVQKVKAPSKPRQPRQQPTSAEPAARSMTAAAATPLEAPATKVTCRPSATAWRLRCRNRTCSTCKLRLASILH